MRLAARPSLLALLCLWLSLAALPAFAQETTTSAEATSPAEPRLRVLVLDLTGENVDPASVRLVGGMLPTSLQGIVGLEVLSGADLRKMAELEAERAVVGCESDGSCLAELAGALGAKLVVSGQLGQLGSQLIMNLALFDSEEARVVSRVTRRVASFDALADEVPSAVRELLAPALAAEGIVLEEETAAPAQKPGPVASAPTSAASAGALPWGVTAGGLVASAVGLGLLGWSGIELFAVVEAEDAYHSAARDVPPSSTRNLATAKARWETVRQQHERWNQTGAWAGPVGALLVTGGLGLAAGGVVWVVVEGLGGQE